MRKLFFLLLAGFFFNTACSAQEDPTLRMRIDSMLAFTKAGNFERMLDYTYPGIFTMASREDLLSSMNESLNGDEISTSFDSVRLVKVYPVFRVGDGVYTLVHHSLQLRMKFTEPITGNLLTEAIENMSSIFGKEHTRFDAATNSFVISLIIKLVAIKDSHSREWSFLNYRDDDRSAESLLGKAVIDQIKALN